MHRTLLLIPFLIIPLVASALAQDLGKLQDEFSRAETSEEREAALASMALLVDQAGEQAKPAVAAIARAVESEDLSTAGVALRLLSELDKAVCLDACLKAAAMHEKVKEAHLQLPEQPKKKVPKHDEFRQELIGSMNRMSALKARIEGFREYQDALVKALVSSPDPRVVNGISDLLNATPSSALSDPLIDALLQRPTAASVVVLAEAILLVSERVEDGEKALKKLKRAKPGRKPKGWARSKNAWIAQEQANLNGRIQRLFSSITDTRDWGRNLHRRIDTFSEEHSLPVAPEWDSSKGIWLRWSKNCAAPLQK